MSAVDLFDQIRTAVLDLQGANYQSYERPLRALGRLLNHEDLSTINRTLTEGLPIPAAGVVALEPNGPHLFLRGIQQTLGVGDAIQVVLRFERAGPVTLRLRAHYH